MGRRLQDVKKKVKGIGGHCAGKLTGKVINDLTTYYGLAIRRNPDSPENMKNEIWATYYHKSSTDETLQHHLCPTGPDSWCKWRKAEALGVLESYTHEKPPLAEDVLTAIKPIYEDLTNKDLLELFSGANTQNNNESFNALIWYFAVDIATYLAVCIFNESFEAILDIIQTMGIVIGSDTDTYMGQRGAERIARSELLTSQSAKKPDCLSNRQIQKCRSFLRRMKASCTVPA
ncbi:uncharacterized protein LOC129235626 [Anastrepha obliqua]|uniref:uncharacterized protein LOC129235626 n=1 Tax=Anastrepha obliqua TaxID=95512 RepID=UPI00240A9B6D|nr:uncharacterized protein LOC129235626 [Anastrepha obliqua]XP_054725542.1 uncharacterized protein LOC129235626 [Anastrepha obliqua]